MLSRDNELVSQLRVGSQPGQEHRLLQGDTNAILGVSSKLRFGHFIETGLSLSKSAF